ncbi:MAG: TonB-dependent receptor [Alphaproteobacteria bacterium]
MSKTLNPIWMAGVALLILPTPFSGSASAQETGAASGRETITVTARQVEESLQDVPGTVNVLSSDVLRTAGVERAEDFINLVPGITIVDAAEVGDSQVNIRGINGARDAENSFAFVLDGILLTNPASFNREFSRLSQIEIFKGPQGAIYGRNAAAGAIIVTTKMPGDEFEADVKLSFGGDNTFVGHAGVSGPIVEDKVFFAISGDYRESDGFYRNTFLDKKVVDDFESQNIDARFVFTPNDDLTIDTKFRYGQVDAASISFNAAFALPFLADLFGVPELFEDVNDHNFVFQPNIDPQNDQKSYEASIKVDYDMDFANLTTWFLYSEVDQSLSADGTSGAFGFFNDEPNCEASVAQLTTSTPLPPPQFFAGIPEASFLGPYTPSTCDGTQYQERNQKDFSFEARLTSNNEGPLQWQFGVYFLDIDRQVGVNLGVDLNQGVLPQLYAPPGSSNPTEALLWDDFDSTVYAVFGQLIYDVTEDFQASVALRYDREERKVTNLVPVDARTQFLVFDLSQGFIGGAPLNPGLDPSLNPNLNPDGSIPDQKRAFEQIQPKVSLTYDINDEFTLFASWGIGFKSGGFNNAGSAATIDLFINGASGGNVIIEDVFEKEKSSAFEAGLKGTLLDGRVQVEAAGFFTDVDNMQFFEFFVGPFGLLRVVNNIDSVDIYGGELSINANVTDFLTIYAAGSVIESEIKSNASRPNTVGNKSPYTPDYTINAGFQVNAPLGNGDIEFVGRFDFNLVGPTWFHTIQNNSVPTIQGGLLGDFSMARRDAYHTINIRAGLQSENWGLTFFIDNVTNERYLEEVIPAPEFGGSFVHPGTERRWGVELTARI